LRQSETIIAEASDLDRVFLVLIFS
jgi:hypothetical protein